MNDKLHMAGLYAMTILALALLGLIGYSFMIIGSHITPDGKVPAAEAFGITALLLSFREVIGTVRAIWDNESRNNLTNRLADATPAPNPPAPQDAIEAATAVADAAKGKADQIERTEG